MSTKERINIQLYGVGAGGQGGQGEIIRDSGGFIYVTKSGDPTKATLTKKDGSSQTNGFALTYGSASFFIDTEVDTQVDLFIMAPGGQFVVKKGVKPGSYDVAVNMDRRQLAVIPFSVTDKAGDATETDTGFNLPECVVEPMPAINVHTADATETIDVGLLSSESGGDADGFAAAVSVANATLVKPTIVNGGNTLGALFEVQDSVNAGDLTHEGKVITGAAAVSVTWTLTAGSDTAKGYIYLPYFLCND